MSLAELLLPRAFQPSWPRTCLACLCTFSAIGHTTVCDACFQAGVTHGTPGAITVRSMPRTRLEAAQTELRLTRARQARNAANLARFHTGTPAELDAAMEALTAGFEPELAPLRAEFEHHLQAFRAWQQGGQA